MTAKEMKLWEINKTVGPMLEGRYAADFNAVNTDVADAVATAFEFAAKGILGRDGDFCVADFKRVACWKLQRLLKDARNRNGLRHGRKSVRTLAVLDASQGEDANDAWNPLLDGESLARFSSAKVSAESERVFALQFGTMMDVLAESGISERKLAVFESSFSCRDRAELAKKFGITVNNANQIVFSVNKAVWKLAPEIRERYRENADRLSDGGTATK